MQAMWRCGRTATFHLPNRRHIRNIFSCAEAQPDIAGWSSLVARRAHNPEVVGSNPAPATKNLQLGGHMASEFFFVPIGLDIHQDVRIRLRRPQGTLPDCLQSDQPLSPIVHSTSLTSQVSRVFTGTRLIRAPQPCCRGARSQPIPAANQRGCAAQCRYGPSRRCGPE